MPEQHITELIRDYGRSLFYGRHSAKRAKRRNRTPFDEGVLGARMGREKDDNPTVSGRTPTRIGKPGLSRPLKPPRPAISIDAVTANATVNGCPSHRSICRRPAKRWRRPSAR